MGGMDADATTQPAAQSSDRACRLCGRQPAENESVLGWLMDRQQRRVSWTCPDCAAANIRAVEAKLDPEWW